MNEWKAVDRRDRCRKEPSRDAEHLYRKLAPNPLPTQEIKRTLKLEAKYALPNINRTQAAERSENAGFCP